MYTKSANTKTATDMSGMHVVDGAPATKICAQNL